MQPKSEKLCLDILTAIEEIREFLEDGCAAVRGGGFELGERFAILFLPKGVLYGTL